MAGDVNLGLARQHVPGLSDGHLHGMNTNTLAVQQHARRQDRDRRRPHVELNSMKVYSPGGGGLRPVGRLGGGFVRAAAYSIIAGVLSAVCEISDQYHMPGRTVRTGSNRRRGGPSRSGHRLRRLASGGDLSGSPEHTGRVESARVVVGTCSRGGCWSVRWCARSGRTGRWHAGSGRCRWRHPSGGVPAGGDGAPNCMPRRPLLLARWRHLPVIDAGLRAGSWSRSVGRCPRLGRPDGGTLPGRVEGRAGRRRAVCPMAATTPSVAPTDDARHQASGVVPWHAPH